MQSQRKTGHDGDARMHLRGVQNAVPQRRAYIDPAEEAMSRNPLLSPPLHFRRDARQRWRVMPPLALNGLSV
jgi:hypothetical protein